MKRKSASLVFMVNAPISSTWDFLSDIEKVGSCVPGVEKVEVIDKETKHSRWTYKVKVGFVYKTFKIMTRMTYQVAPEEARFEGHSEDGFMTMKGGIRNEAAGEEATRVCYELDVFPGEAIPASLYTLLEGVIRERAQRDAEQFARNVKKNVEANPDSGDDQDGNIISIGG